MDLEFVGMPILQMLLVAIIFLALFVEIKTGGMGIGVALGIVAAGVFFSSQYVQGLVGLYHIGLFLAGILLIIVEMLVPTVGILAAVGVAAMLYSLVLAMGGDMNALIAMLVSLVVAIIIFAFIVNKLPSSRLWQKIVLRDRSTSERGFVSAESPTALIGRTGEVLTELRPAGSARIDGVPVDVVSEGVYIEKGELVQVIAANGSRVVVRRVDNG